ncbi:hypothetical protein MMC21_003278 [Puttea exsequens]|nr:hypothetical protein [Puttea exsequens]
MLPASPSPFGHPSIDNLVEAVQSLAVHQYSNEHLHATAAKEQTAHSELQEMDWPNDSEKAGTGAILRNDQSTPAGQAVCEAGNGESMCEASVGSFVGLCHYKQEDYKHMLHMQLAETRDQAGLAGRVPWEVDYGTSMCVAKPDELCRFQREDYKHMVHMQLIARSMKS